MGRVFKIGLGRLGSQTGFVVALSHPLWKKVLEEKKTLSKNYLMVPLLSTKETTM